MLPMSAPAAAIAFTVTGVLAVLVADYGRNVEPLRLPAQAIPFTLDRGTPSGLREAA
jgi:hypothetical protein